MEEGQGPLVILLHGYPFLWYLWRHQIKALAAAGYRVVALDQRGYGQSDCPEDIDAYDLTHLVGDVVGLMRSFQQMYEALINHLDKDEARVLAPPEGPSCTPVGTSSIHHELEKVKCPEFFGAPDGVAFEA